MGIHRQKRPGKLAIAQQVPRQANVREAPVVEMQVTICSSWTLAPHHKTTFSAERGTNLDCSVVRVRCNDADSSTPYVLPS